VKLPAVAIAAAFCCGIALGLWAAVAKFEAEPALLPWASVDRVALRGMISKN
jgi:hypothetical protein